MYKCVIAAVLIAVIALAAGAGAVTIGANP